MTYEDETHNARDHLRMQVKNGPPFDAGPLVSELERIANFFRCTFEEVFADVFDSAKRSEFLPMLITLVVAERRGYRQAAELSIRNTATYDEKGMLNCWAISDSSQVYFAFVEDVNNFNAEVAEPNEKRETCFGNLLSARRGEEIPSPERLVWFDAVPANLFMRLRWREEECPIGNVEASIRRRQNLQSLQEDREVFRSFAVPLSRGTEFESSCINAFQPCSWHIVMLGDQAGTPVAVLPDFGIDNYPDAPIQNMAYAGACRAGEFANLNEIFSLNFLPDLGVAGNA